MLQRNVLFSFGLLFFPHAIIHNFSEGLPKTELYYRILNHLHHFFGVRILFKNYSFHNGPIHSQIKCSLMTETVKANLNLTKDSWFEHIAITAGTPEWLEAVDAETYEKL